jgi:hypothetical protein
MKRLVIGMSMLCCVAGTTYGQLVMKQAHADTVKNSVLAVVMEEPDRAMERKLKKKPEALAKYRQSVSDFNNNLKGIVQQEWRYAKGIRFVTRAEAKQLTTARTPGYCLLEVRDIQADESMLDEGLDGTPRMSSFESRRALSLVQTSRPRFPIAVSFLPESSITQGTVLFLVQHLQHQIAGAQQGITRHSDWKEQMKSRVGSLKEKTLLLYEPFISNKLGKQLTMDSVKTFYHFRYQLAEPGEVDRRILQKDAAYAYILVTPSVEFNDDFQYHYFIIDAGDGTILYSNDNSVLGTGGKFHPYHLAKVNDAVRE